MLESALRRPRNERRATDLDAWDHLATQPDQPPRIGQCTKLHGMARYARDGWSDVYHYEASSMVRILRISFSSH